MLEMIVVGAIVAWPWFFWRRSCTIKQPAIPPAVAKVG